jgi:putative DNA primase/helicase
MENKTETKAPNLLAAALKYHAAGYKVIFTNDSKIPVVGSWSKYRTSQTAEDINAMFKANESKVKGLAVLCTDGMEVIDIDQKYSLDGRLMTDYLAAVSAEIGQDAFLAGVTISMTVQGGNQKLASRATVESEGAGSRVLLETRAKGGYIVVPPTKGYKFDVFDKTLAPKISNEWRNTLINVARTFDEVTNNFVARNVQPTPVEVKGAHLSTIDAFNEAHTPYELLIQAGWTFLFTKGGNDHLTRPGKRSGTSAGYNEAKNLVYIFTSSTEFENERAYNAFQVYTVLNHSAKS